MSLSPRTVGRYLLDLRSAGQPIRDRIVGQRQLVWFDHAAARPDWL